MLTFFLIKETTYVGSLNFTMSSVLRLVDHGVCGCVGLCMAMYVYVWLCRAMYSYVGLCVAVYGYVGLCRAMYGYVGLCMAM